MAIGRGHSERVALLCRHFPAIGLASGTGISLSSHREGNAVRRRFFVIREGQSRSFNCLAFYLTQSGGNHGVVECRATTSRGSHYLHKLDATVPEFLAVGESFTTTSAPVRHESGIQHELVAVVREEPAGPVVARGIDGFSRKSRTRGKEGNSKHCEDDADVQRGHGGNLCR